MGVLILCSIYLFIYLYVFFFSQKWVAADLHFIESPRTTVLAKHLFTLLLKKKSHLHLGWPEGEKINGKFSFLETITLRRQTANTIMTFS